MATKPATTPRWADVGGDIVEPATGKKDVGWAAGERPANSFFNWLLNLIYLWMLYLRDGVMKGDGVDATSAPQMQWVDQDDRTRMFVSPSGLPGGRFFRESVNFAPIGASVGTGVSDQPVAGVKMSGTTGTSVGADVVEASAGSAFRPVSAVRLRVLDAATTQGVRVHTGGTGTQAIVGGDLDDQLIEMEWDAYMTAVGSSGVDVLMGLNNDPDSVAIDNEVNNPSFVFRKRESDTNWQASVGDSIGTTVVDTGVPPVADTLQRFRMEYHGVNTPVGVDNASATVRWFIDGTKVAETADGNVPTAAQSNFGIQLFTLAANGGPTGDFDLFVLSGLEVRALIALAGYAPA